jgi:hypothetical protein
VSKEACVDCPLPGKSEDAALAKQSKTFVLIFDWFAQHSSLTRTRRVTTAVHGKLCVGCWPLEKREDAALTKPSETLVFIFDRFARISH